MNGENFEQEPPRSPLERILGDRPVALLIRLVVLSLVVGFFMQMFGLNVQDLLQAASNVLHDAFRDSGAMLRSGLSYVVTGAAIVVPLWLIARLTARRSRR